MNNEQEKDFREFCFETGKYEHRHTGVNVYIEYINNLLQDAMGKSEGMDYHEFKMKELWDKCEEAKQNFETEDFIRAICDIQQLLTKITL